MEKGNNHRVVCFGEVLWDIFPSGAVPGGAPMNVTYHLHKEGRNPALITRIGNDQKGKQLLEIFSSRGVCTDFFQLDDKYETGKVFAHPNEQHQVVYEIVKPVAWDFIEWDDAYTDLVSQAEHFVFGSLAARNKESEKTLMHLLEIAKNKVLDINLRPPHFNRKIVVELLGKTDFLKLNLDELELITGWFNDYRSIEDKVNSLAERFRLPGIVVTMGGEGAFLLINGISYRHPGFPVIVKDTVGSGDAFLAGLLSKLMDYENPRVALEFANGLGAFIATKEGACPNYEIEEVYDLINASNVKTQNH